MNRQTFNKYRSKKWIKYPLLAFFIFMVVLLLLPVPRFNDPYATIIQSSKGDFLGAQIAKDGQWRFAALDTVPKKFEQCLIRFEDNYFYYHVGFNPLAIVRAVRQDIGHKRVVSGASTITMQVVRMSRKGRERRVVEKCVELLLAMRLELAYSKRDILKLYATHAPFGGNVVGLEAASWRYYRCAPNNLSWGEAATLAVLPNAPSLIYPGKNAPKLRAKRDRLLEKLKNDGTISEMDYKLACMEPLPQKPLPLPQLAPHLVDRVLGESPQQRIKTTLNEEIQKRVVAIVEQHHRELRHNHINNACVLVVDVETGAVLAYVGNTVPEDEADKNENDVDMIRANRSSGSILKPFLFGKMLDDGKMLPHTIMKDVPVRFGGYCPQNYTLQFDGAVPASEALSRSLNIPALLMLKEYGVANFQDYLKSLGLTSLKQDPSYYGLSLILGGAEVNLWELCGAYSSWARILKHYSLEHQYYASDIRLPYYQEVQGVPAPQKSSPKEESTSIGAGAIWWTFEAMKNLKRPMGEQGWKNFSSSNTIAWKTGTSFGFRDAWAIGISPRYVVGVWVGNADGEGRPGINGVGAAAPVLFDVFGSLSHSSWFEKPLSDLYPATVCRKSGHRASQYCPEVDTIYVPEAGLNTSVCPYHKLLHLDETGRYQVNSDCYDPSRMLHKSWYVLPPVMEWFYKQKHYDYKAIPEFLAGCGSVKSSNIQLLYPEFNTQVYIPLEINGKKGFVIFKAAHHNPKATIYWHMDDQYIGLTKAPHSLAVQPAPGKHLLTLVDDQGTVFKRYFTVIGKSE